MKPKSSAVWHYFELVPNKKSFAKCKLCSKQVSRGPENASLASLTTSSLMSHLTVHHPSAHREVLQKRRQVQQAKQSATTRDAEVTFCGPNTTASATSPCQSEQRATSANASPSDSQRQQTFKEALDKNRPYAPHDDKQIGGDFRVSEWIISAMLPYTTVDNDQFKELIRFLDKKFSLKSEKYYRTAVIPSIYDRVYHYVHQEISNSDCQHFAFSTDMWTSNSMASFIGVTAFFVDQQWIRHSVTLGCFEHVESHTADEIATHLEAIIKEWKLEKKVHMVQRDSAPAMVQAMVINNWSHASCFAHTIALVVKKAVLSQSSVALVIRKCRTLMRYFHSSAPAAQALKEFQQHQSNGREPLTVMIDCDTRWNSTHDMLVRACELKGAIISTCDRTNVPVDKTLDNRDWDVMTKVASYLSPFKKATMAAQRDDALMSQVIPLVSLILHDIEKLPSVQMVTTKTELIKSVENYFGGTSGRSHFPDVESDDRFTKPTILDPRFKLKVFRSRSKAGVAKIRLIDELRQESTRDADADIEDYVDETSANISMDSGDIWAGLSELTSSEDTAETEDSAEMLITPGSSKSVRDPPISVVEHLEQYLMEVPLKGKVVDTNPLNYWQKKSGDWPLLSKVARKYLTSPIGSVASERDFKTASNIATDVRNRLLPENIEKLLFLKKNLKKIGYNSQKLPLPK